MFEDATLDYQDESKSASNPLLVALIAFSQKIGCFELLAQIRVPMKAVVHSVQIKIVTLLLSYMLICRSTNDIAKRLAPEKLAVEMLEIAGFADDSTFSRFFARIDPAAVEDLRNVAGELHARHGLAHHLHGLVLVDLDSTGLLVKGNLFELADAGYFSKHPGEIGYQLSLACASNAHKEVLAHLLTPGHVNGGSQFWDLLYALGDSLGFLDERVFIRADRGYGVGSYIAHLLELRVGFLIKGRDPRTARKWVHLLGNSIHWGQVDETCWVADIGLRPMPKCPKAVHTLLVRTWDAKTAQFEYSYLVTSLPWSRCSEVDIFHFYNQRVTLEKLIERSKNVWQITHLPTHAYWGLKFYFELRFLAYNLVLWYRTYVLGSDESFQAMTVFELVSSQTASHVAVEKRADQGWVFYLANAPKLVQSLLVLTRNWLVLEVGRASVFLGEVCRLHYDDSDLIHAVWLAGPCLGRPLLSGSCKS